jgi:hypothetical protein
MVRRIASPAKAVEKNRYFRGIKTALEVPIPGGIKIGRDT